MTKSLPIYILAIAILISAILFFVKPLEMVQGAGWIGYQSHLQYATTTTVGPDTVVVLFDDQSTATCHSRVVSTGGSGIHLSLGEYNSSSTGVAYTFASSTLGAGAGIYQPASTTVAYDAGLYGCGLFTAWGYASDTVTVSSF